jgi:hypothetical protein
VLDASGLDHTPRRHVEAGGRVVEQREQRLPGRPTQRQRYAGRTRARTGGPTNPAAIGATPTTWSLHLRSSASLALDPQQPKEKR